MTMEHAKGMRLILRTHFETAMEMHQLDVWISPAVTVLEGPEAFVDTAFQLPWVVCGLPSLVLPAGCVEDMPLGIQLAGHWYGDEQLLQRGKLIEEMLESTALRPSRWF